MASSFTRFLDHTQRRITVGRTPLDEWSARRRDLYLTTHNTHNWQTSMRPPGGIRTHDLSKRAAADLRLRLRGHWDQDTDDYSWKIITKCVYSYVNLLYYKQRSLLHVSATYCDLHQRGVLWRICYTERQNHSQIQNVELYIKGLTSTLECKKNLYAVTICDNLHVHMLCDVRDCVLYTGYEHVRQYK